MTAVPFGILAAIFLAATIFAFVLDAMNSVLFRNLAVA
jgi:hypothetical protein